MRHKSQGSKAERKPATSAAQPEAKRQEPDIRNQRLETRNPKPETTSERLNKFLARCGVASRRGADELIAAGRVSVNGKRVDEAGVRIDPERDRVEVDGKPVQPERRVFVLMLNKPRGVVSTLKDPHAAETLKPWLERYPERLYPIGRLDRDSEGLLLLTNDGQLANLLTHPRYHLEKEYRVSVEGILSENKARRLHEGVMLGDGMTLPAQVKAIDVSEGRTRFTLVLRAGRNRQIRRICEAVDLRVIRLVRLRVGPLVLSRLRAGEIRELTDKEIHQLRSAKPGPAAMPHPSLHRPATKESTR